MFQETNWRNCPSKPKEIGPFPHFNPIFPPVPPKNWALPPSQKLLFRIDMEQGYLLKKFRLDKLKITDSISNC